MTRQRQDLGEAGENLAVRELTARGYAILERRYRTRHGEIDIIAEHEGTLVFVEVRARATAEFGRAAETVTDAKKRKVTAMAVDYLARHRIAIARAASTSSPSTCPEPHARDHRLSERLRRRRHLGPQTTQTNTDQHGPELAELPHMTNRASRDSSCAICRDFALASAGAAGWPRRRTTMSSPGISGSTGATRTARRGSSSGSSRPIPRRLPARFGLLQVLEDRSRRQPVARRGVRAADRRLHRRRRGAPRPQRDRRRGAVLPGERALPARVVPLRSRQGDVGRGARRRAVEAARRRLRQAPSRARRRLLHARRLQLLRRDRAVVRQADSPAAVPAGRQPGRRAEAARARLHAGQPLLVPGRACC